MPPKPKTSKNRKAKTISPDQHKICVLYGSEPLLMRQHFDAIRSKLESEHGNVDTVPLDGQTATLADVFDELQSMSLLHPHKIVVIDESESFVSSHRKALERYAQNPAEQSTLIFRARKWAAGNLDKLIAKVGFVLKCEPLSAPQAKTWLINQAKTSHKCDLTARAAEALIERLGCDLTKLDGELNKLAANVDPGSPIEPEHVEKITGISSSEQAWQVQETVLSLFQKDPRSGRSRSPVKAASAINKIHRLIDQAGQADVLVSYFIADLIRKLYIGNTMWQQGQSEQSIAEQLKLWGPRRAVWLAVVKNFHGSLAAQLLDRILQYDARAKSGRGTTIRNIECFCYDLSDKFS